MIKIKDVIGKFYVKNWRTGPCLSFTELNSLVMIGQQEQMQQAKCKKVKKKKRKKRIVWQDVMSDSSVSSGTSELVFSQIFFELSQILFESKNMQIAKPFFLTLHKALKWTSHNPWLVLIPYLVRRVNISHRVNLT